jgi:Fe-S cluster assembly ATP-binding protein
MPRIVSDGVNSVRTKTGILLITHTNEFSTTLIDLVHMLGGKIVESGGSDLALHLEEQGYDWVREKYESISV